jgi:branched-chain amino acid aminotransferase
MLKDRIVYSGGAYIPWDKAILHVSSHSFARGSAIFEVLSLHETRSGAVVFRLDEHLKRLFQSAKFLNMKLPISNEDFQAAVRETVNRNNLKKGMIKIICFYPETAFDILPPENAAKAVILAIDPEQDLPGMKASEENGTTLCISRWQKLDPQTVPIEAKASANYLNGMMARLEAKKRGFKYAVMLDTQGFIAEGGTESIFWVKEGILKTPAAGTILQSITRKSILESASKDGIPVAEIRLGPEALLEADEIFLSCTPFKTLCVRQIENRILENVPGPLSRKMIGLLEKIADGKDDRYQHWLFSV